MLCVAMVARAEEQSLIVVEQSSFKPLQSDALTGVAIDQIGVDSSRRPCARIKVKINRMTKADIDDLEVRIVTNNQLTKCKTAEYDNGLIVEMTAKPNSRFYLHHPRLGDSNEVTVNLEANKEYRIDAYLNQLLSITVISDVVGADVYIDGIFKGQTGANKMLVVHEIVPELHRLRLDYSGREAEMSIDVNSQNLVFVQNMLPQSKTAEVTAPKPKLSSNKITTAPYKVGDYFNNGVKEGVVFQVSEDGRHGKIVSMTDGGKMAWTVDRSELGRLIGASSEDDGEKNMAVVMQIVDWQNKYPAFKWCAEIGEGWYLPSKRELQTIYKHRKVINLTLSTDLVKSWHWSSTERDKSRPWYVNISIGDTSGGSKSDEYYIRAVSRF